jgi:hypothetical protein
MIDEEDAIAAAKRAEANATAAAEKFGLDPADLIPEAAALAKLVDRAEKLSYTPGWARKLADGFGLSVAEMRQEVERASVQRLVILGMPGPSARRLAARGSMVDPCLAR